jgi:hypothetical protein
LHTAPKATAANLQSGAEISYSLPPGVVKKTRGIGPRKYRQIICPAKPKKYAASQRLLIAFPLSEPSSNARQSPQFCPVWIDVISKWGLLYDERKVMSMLLLSLIDKSFASLGKTDKRLSYYEIP